MQIPEVATYPSWLWAGNEWQGVVAELPARSSNNISGNKVICGDWTRVVVALWGQGTIAILSDPLRAEDAGGARGIRRNASGRLWPSARRMDDCEDPDSGAQ